jgi:hypothetical protein
VDDWPAEQGSHDGNARLDEVVVERLGCHTKLGVQRRGVDGVEVVAVSIIAKEEHAGEEESSMEDVSMQQVEPGAAVNRFVKNHSHPEAMATTNRYTPL